MPGVAPKDPGQRRRYNQPARGEWVDLEPLDAPVLPEYLPIFTIPARLWTAWREDPVTSQYGPADIAALVELAVEWEARTFIDRDRQMDKLGLTPKGKRDLRWRTPNEVKTLKKQPATPRVRPLRVVADTAKED